MAEGGPLARRYPVDMAPFAAAADDGPAAQAALAALVVRSGRVALFETAPALVPAGTVAAVRRVAEQMVAGPAAAPVGAVIRLTEADAPAMRALVELTKPGPFGPRTHELGRFVGIRAGGVLAAMAGERMRTDGFTEITAVCTHPDHRGHGHGRAVLDAIAALIRADGAAPFLHVFTDNPTALALYHRAAYTIRRTMHLTLLNPAPG